MKPISRPLNPNEIYKICQVPFRLVKYSDLHRFDSLDEIFNGLKAIVLLFESRKGYGHWTCLIKQKDRICFFDPYAFVPDDELHFSNIGFRKMNNMDLPYLTALLYFSKLPCDYNDHQFQRFDKRILTCGRHTAWRLKHHHLTNDEYIKQFGHLKDKDIVKLTENYI